MMKRNNASRWVCAAVPVKKSGSTDQFRITNDYRPINSMAIPIAAATPNLAMVTSKVSGSVAFEKFDLFKGFWQLPLHEECQEIFSFMTEDGVYTSTRVPQGAVDLALHFQAQMNHMFADMLFVNVLIYIDDIIIFTPTREEFLAVLEEFFARLHAFNLKLSVMKSAVFQSEVQWCGKIVDGHGVRHDPERVSVPRALPPPANAAELQYLPCAANWLLESIVDYGQVVAALQEGLDSVLKNHSRKKHHAIGLLLSWTEDETSAYQALLDVIATSAKLLFSEDDAVTCLFTNASNKGYGIVVTKVKH